MPSEQAISGGDGTSLDDQAKIDLCNEAISLINENRRKKGKNDAKLEAVIEIPCSFLSSFQHDHVFNDLDVHAERDDCGYVGHCHLKGYPPSSDDARRMAFIASLLAGPIRFRQMDAGGSGSFSAS